MHEYITPDEAAAELGVTANWIRQLCANGRIPGAKRFNRSWMVPRGAQIESVGSGRPLRTLEIPGGEYPSAIEDGRKRSGKKGRSR